jgi:hypothetical protein
MIAKKIKQVKSVVKDRIRPVAPEIQVKIPKSI